MDTYPTGGSIDSSFKACADDCGSYNSYQLASIEPDQYTMKGEYEMTIKVLLRDYTLAVGLFDTFSYEVIGCQPSFKPLSPFLYPAQIIYQLDREPDRLFDVPAFVAFNIDNCMLKESVATWISFTNGTQNLTRLPDFMQVLVDPKDPFNVTLEILNGFDQEKKRFVYCDFFVNF